MANLDKLFEIDPYLSPFKEQLNFRNNYYLEKRTKLLGKNKSLVSFANGYKYFGFHKQKDGYVYREWAENAEKMYLTGDFNNWDLYKNEMKNIGNGVFEIYDPNLKPGQKVQAIVIANGETLRRVPSYATRVVQDENTYLWCAEIEDTLEYFDFEDNGFKPDKTPFIYECHIGMSSEEGKVSSYKEFTENILPNIKKLGYNTIQIMAVMEHPYYGSFGYQVSSFFAISSRFGKSQDLKELIKEAHKNGIAVLLDVVHSHAVKNTGDGLNEFDGTEYQYFHKGNKGEHPAWGTKLFNYGKPQVIHFLLSNLKYYLDVFHFDGFRFDGVTSMLYQDHGLGSSFTNYGMYFSENTDIDAVTYLTLANELIHKFNKNAITIAEDMSGMPGMCLPINIGGIGFDFRLSMGVPDLWIKLIKEYTDDTFDIAKLYYELIMRRPQEKNIGYCESHDQALVGDKTIMFRLCDAEMYWNMAKNKQSFIIDRGIALHKMIRLVTASLAGEGYLNFMGNEFGHPEWIDFPREGNNFSYHYCRRQWSLKENQDLKYHYLNDFDKAMISFLQNEKVLKRFSDGSLIHQDDKILSFTKNDLVFVFNFNPTKSFEGYFIPTKLRGKYKVILNTDNTDFGGFGRIQEDYIYKTEKTKDGKSGFKCYLPNRTAIVFKKTN